MPKFIKGKFGFDVMDDTIVKNIEYDQKLTETRDETGMIVATSIDYTEVEMKGITNDPGKLSDSLGKEIRISGKRAIVTDIKLGRSQNGFDTYELTGKMYSNDDALDSMYEKVKEDEKKAEQERKRLAEIAKREKELERTRVKTRIIRLDKLRKKKTGQE